MESTVLVSGMFKVTLKDDYTDAQGALNTLR
jgi:hypothetical protein